MFKMNKAILEGLKELLRTGVLAAIPVLIDGLTKGVVDFRLAGIAFAIAILRAIDKLLHEADVKSPLDFRGF